MFEVDTDEVWNAAKMVEIRGNEYGGEMLGVTRTLSGLGNMAGDDYVGKVFGSLYDPLANDVVLAARDLVEALEGVAIGLVTTANNFSTADHQSTAGGKGSPQTRPIPQARYFTYHRPAPASGGSHLDIQSFTSGPLASALMGMNPLSQITALFPKGHQDRLYEAAGAWRTTQSKLIDLSSGLNKAIDGITIDSGGGGVNALKSRAGMSSSAAGKTVHAWQDSMRQFTSRIWGSKPWVAPPVGAQGGVYDAPAQIMTDCAKTLADACQSHAEAISSTREALEERLGAALFATILGIVFSETGVGALIAAEFDEALLADCVRILIVKYYKPIQQVESAWQQNGLREKLDAALKSMPTLNAMEARAESVGDRAMHDFQYPGLDEKNAPGKGSRGRQDPGDSKYPIDLAGMEGVSKSHTIDRHVGLTDGQLQQRLGEDSTADPGASSFSDLSSAQRLTQQTINANDSDIQNWLRDNRNNGTLPLTYHPGETTGRIWTRGDPHAQEANGVQVILRKNPKTNPPFTVISAFPSG